MIHDPRCPPFEALSRASSGASEPTVLRHLVGCSRCSRAVLDLGAIREAARGLPERAPPAGWAARVEQQLAALPQRTGPSRRWIGAAAGLAAAAALAISAAVLLSEPAGPRAELAASAGARLRHMTVHPLRAGEPAVERIELDEGTVSLDVERLGAGERLVVATRDAEVEVRGTSFEVEAGDGRLLRVAVRTGRVAVRHRGAEVLLTAGESWTAPAPIPEATPEPAPERARVPERPIEPAAAIARASGPVVAAPGPTAAPPEETSPSPGAPSVPVPADPASIAEEAFAAGWEALRAGNAGRAADRFERAREAAADGGLEQDASYWRIVALQRIGEDAGATREAEEFLRRFPASHRAGELSLLVGAARLSAGDRAGARRHFERAARDASPGVRARAREGLEVLVPR